VTNSQGVRVEETGYLPFGATLFRKAYQSGNWDSVYRFTGQEYDAEYDLYNYNARLYDPVMCRFTTADTIVPDWTNPQTLNRYAYVTNNPLKYTDPSGHALHWAAAIFISMLVGMVVGGVMAYLNGGSVAKGMFYGAITGAISGAFFGVAGAVSAKATATQAAMAHVVAGAMSGAVNAAITGGDIGQGTLIGAISAGASKWLGGKMGTNSMPGPEEFAARTALGAVMGGVTAKMAGGDFAQGAFQGALTAALAMIANDLVHDIIDKVKLEYAQFKEAYNRHISEMYGLDLKLADTASPLSVLSIAVDTYGNIAGELGVNQVKTAELSGAQALDKTNDLYKANRAATKGVRVAARTRLLTSSLRVTSRFSGGIGAFSLGYSIGARINSTSYALAEIMWNVRLTH
jgi:RHS repeat-associated protein